MISIDDWEDDRQSALLQYQAANDNEKRVVRGMDSTPRCRPFKVQVGALPTVVATPASVARAALEKWRLDNPQTDCKILPRAPRNKGGHDLAEFMPELAWWRAMTNASTAWDSMVTSAANDDAPGMEERENEEERPSVNELVASLPKRIKAAMAADIMPTDIRILTNDIEWSRGRIARLGGLKFATAVRREPDEKTDTSNATGPVMDMPRAGELLRFQPEGRRGWSGPTVHSREHRGGQTVSIDAYRNMLPDEVVPPGSPDKGRRDSDKAKLKQWLAASGYSKRGLPTETNFRAWLRSQDFSGGKYYEPGLPWEPAALSKLFMSGRTVPGAGQKDGTGNYEPTRRQADTGETAETWLADAECLDRFRNEHAGDAAVLDAAMVAANMEDIAATCGASSAHTGKKRLTKACETLRAFRAAFGVQILPCRAA